MVGQRMRRELQLLVWYFQAGLRRLDPATEAGAWGDKQYGIDSIHGVETLKFRAVGGG